MIVIASDKFKGTLSSLEAGESIRCGLAGLERDIRVVAMADGGEGTAEALGAANVAGRYYAFADADGALCAYVPSCGEGMLWQSGLRQPALPVWLRSTSPVGAAVVEASRARAYDRIYIGIGGTMTADCGLGMFTEIKKAGIATDNIIGLADVSAPLYSSEGLSAISFLAQKGAGDSDVEFCRKFFKALYSRYGSCNDRHGGAGGGIGYALETILGCTVIAGAPFVLDRAIAGMPAPELLVTGEGRIDCQTLGGKVVGAVRSYGKARGIPVAAFCGSKEDGMSMPNVFACVADGAPIPESPAESLEKCACAAIEEIRKLYT